jgi:ABC-type glutathione transport system ATPase component
MTFRTAGEARLHAVAKLNFALIGRGERVAVVGESRFGQEPDLPRP